MILAANKPKPRRHSLQDGMIKAGAMPAGGAGLGLGIPIIFAAMEIKATLILCRDWGKAKTGSVPGGKPGGKVEQARIRATVDGAVPDAARLHKAAPGSQKTYYIERFEKH